MTYKKPKLKGQTYKLEYKCCNCQKIFEEEFEWGKEPAALYSPQCPNCGCFRTYKYIKPDERTTTLYPMMWPQMPTIVKTFEGTPSPPEIWCSTFDHKQCSQTGLQ